jgi:hypothetical protein
MVAIADHFVKIVAAIVDRFVYRAEVVAATVVIVVAIAD